MPSFSLHDQRPDRHIPNGSCTFEKPLIDIKMKEPPRKRRSFVLVGSAGDGQDALARCRLCDAGSASFLPPSLLFLIASTLARRASERSVIFATTGSGASITWPSDLA